MIASVEIRLHGLLVHRESMQIREGLVNETSVLWRLAGSPFEIMVTFESEPPSADAESPAGQNGATLSLGVGD